ARAYDDRAPRAARQVRRAGDRAWRAAVVAQRAALARLPPPPLLARRRGEDRRRHEMALCRARGHAAAYGADRRRDAAPRAVRAPRRDSTEGARRARARAGAARPTRLRLPAGGP